MLQDGAGAREGRAARRVLGPGGAEEPGERGAARLAHELVDGREQGELPVPEEAVEQLRHEGVEPMRTDPATRLPEYLGGGGDRRPVGPRTAARPGRRPGPWQTAEQPDGRFAVDAGHGHHLIQELALLGAGRLPIPLPLHCGVFSKAGSRHGSLLGWIGHRDF